MSAVDEHDGDEVPFSSIGRERAHQSAVRDVAQFNAFEQVVRRQGCAVGRYSGARPVQHRSEQVVERWRAH